MLAIASRPLVILLNFLNPPRHIRLSSARDSIDACLRDLERKANLSRGDLYIKGEPRCDMCSWPAMRNGTQYFISSKTAEDWKVGYISGTVFETEGRTLLNQKQLERMSPITAAAVSVSHVCVGRLHISKNCPGIYQGSVCMTCGDRSSE